MRHLSPPGGSDSENDKGRGLWGEGLGCLFVSSGRGGGGGGGVDDKECENRNVSLEFVIIIVFIKNDMNNTESDDRKRVAQKHY